MPAIGVRKLETKVRRTRAFFQCELDDPDVTDFSSIPAKASRILTDLPGMLLVGVPGWPELDDDHHYLGPLSAECGHDHRFTWTDRSVPGGKFYSADTAAWRSGFCHAVAAAALADFAEHVDPQTPLQKKFKFKPAENLDGAVRHQLPKNLADKLLQLLQAKIWPMTKRTAVKGRGACLGLSYGMARRPYITPWTMHGKEIVDLLRLHIPGLPCAADFRWTSIQVNHNSVAQEHADENNEGPSLILSVGEYSGGRLVYKGVPIDIRNAYYLFDGTQLHASEEYDGERFSIVLFTHSSFQDADAETRMALGNLGLRVPRPPTEQSPAPS